MSDQLVYSIVYTFSGAGGTSGWGRQCVTCGVPIDTYDRIVAVETAMLEEAKRGNPTITSLMMVSFTPLRAEH